MVLIHGFPLDQSIWCPQMESLASTHRVITPDLPGFGQSPQAGPFSIESLADHLHAFLREIDALPCILGGLSMGGYIAFAFVAKYASDLLGLILADTRPGADTPQAKMNRQITIDLAKSQGPVAVARTMLPKMLTPHAPAMLMMRVQSIMESCSTETIEHASLAMRDRKDYTPLLPAIRVPTLILVGQADELTSPALAQSMHELIQGSQIVIIPGAAHLSTLEQPVLVSQAIRRWLNEGA